MTDRIVHYALTGAVGLVSGIVGTIGAVNVSLAELRENDARQDVMIERIDREGTQVSRADRASILEFKGRLDRMEAAQSLMLAQGARNEALLLDLKSRLRQ